MLHSIALVIRAVSQRHPIKSSRQSANFPIFFKFNYLNVYSVHLQHLVLSFSSPKKVLLVSVSNVVHSFQAIFALSVYIWYVCICTALQCSLTANTSLLATRRLVCIAEKLSYRKFAFILIDTRVHGCSSCCWS